MLSGLPQRLSVGPYGSLMDIYHCGDRRFSPAGQPGTAVLQNKGVTPDRVFNIRTYPFHPRPIFKEAE